MILDSNRSKVMHTPSIPGVDPAAAAFDDVNNARAGLGATDHPRAKKNRGSQQPVSEAVNHKHAPTENFMRPDLRGGAAVRLSQILV
jgi:hypothetical protein